MKKRLLIVALVLPGWLYAQVPYGLSVDRDSAQPQQAIKVTVNFEAASRWCGLRVDLGDGDVRDLLVDNFPLTLSKPYDTPGRYVLRAEGRFVLRGLTSALGCAGKARAVTVSVGELPRDAHSAGSDEDAKDELERRKRRAELEREPHKRRREEVREPPSHHTNPGGAPTTSPAPAAPVPPRDSTLKVF
ncbi:hypothetical protein [Variovorax paradoxus]|uniref:hypothetical protein n=1 Tax=Variovorax paradoxus TaxID=34073 RepID=UPI002782FC68|nr:hypothetical protein [Variovorax paradoxus]MDP9932878.1 hypothetical protein [Variovorax paradoxus]